MRVVVSYDISCDRSRTRVAGILEGILTRVQFSVFEGDVPGKILKKTIQKAMAESVVSYQLSVVS